MREFLDNPEVARAWLTRCGFRDPAVAHRNFLRIAEIGVPVSLLRTLKGDLEQYLPGLADPDMAFNNFERFLCQARSPLSVLSFLERQPLSLAMLMQLLAASQYFSNLIISNSDYFDFIWEQGSIPLDPKTLRKEILAEIKSVHDDPEHVLALIRRHRGRELLRIGFRDIIAGEPLERITQSISDLADCLVEVALAVAYHRQARRWGEPRSPSGKLVRLVVLGLGKLGGEELNYSSDIDLILIYEEDGKTDGAAPYRESVTNAQFFSAVVREMVHLLAAKTDHGFAYRVDLRLRPHGGQSELCQSLSTTLAYYDRHGRTWERQALVKARPIAGYKTLGKRFLREVSSFVHRRYLTFVEINELKRIKRQIERATETRGGETTNLKTGRGGIRDIEFVVQFLQLLHGGVHARLREPNTLRALRELVTTGCLNLDEHAALENAYRFLRKAEHRLQFMFDLARHDIPEAPEELDKLAIRLGYVSGTGVRPGEEFLSDLRAITERNRVILGHLMTGLFPEPEKNGAVERVPESDLILDPEPTLEQIRAVLGKYRFSNPREAFKNLMQLGVEAVPFLSSIRCRHFLASVAPILLEAISQAPDPDMALINLEKVTSSLGAKGVLWESLSQNPPLLALYVQLCSWSQFLSEILINNPGMIDELLDTLVMNRPASRAELATELARLLKGAEDAQPILHSFKNVNLLGIGVNDILGKRTIPETTRSLTDLADVLVGTIIDMHWSELTRKHGFPRLEDGETLCRFALVGLGKFGGGELGYHGDIDIILIYEEDGSTRAEPAERLRTKVTSNFEFFTDLLQRLTRTAGQMTPSGKLYSIDLRLRPTGRSGALVTPLFRFLNHVNTCALWERQALTRARVFHGEPGFVATVGNMIHDGIVGREWQRGNAREVLEMRQRLEESRPTRDIKRGPGGQADVEFSVQLTQIKHARRHPEILESNIWRALDRLEAAGLWDARRSNIMRSAYSFLRLIECRLRIVYNLARNDLPDEPAELDKLAQRAGFATGEALMGELNRLSSAARDEMLEIIEEG